MSVSVRESLINAYILAYNTFDIKGMSKCLHQDILFENISGGKTDLTINGLAAFAEQAEKVAGFFKSREQIIEQIVHHADETEVKISYHAVLAIDLPNGLKTGDKINLKGRSVFKFKSDKIIALTDVS